MTKFPLIREAAKENGGILPSAIVANLRDIPESEGDDLYALVVVKDEELYEDVVATENGYEPQPGDLVDIREEEPYCIAEAVPFEVPLTIEEERVAEADEEE